MRYYIYSGHNKFDLQFLQTAINKEYIAIDWDNDIEGRKKYEKGNYPLVSNLPCLIDTKSKTIIEIKNDFIECEKLFNYKIENEDYKFQRLQEYEKQGLTANDWIRAIIQKEVDNDSSEYDSLIKKRIAIKEKILKE